VKPLTSWHKNGNLYYAGYIRDICPKTNFLKITKIIGKVRKIDNIWPFDDFSCKSLFRLDYIGQWRIFTANSSKVAELQNDHWMSCTIEVIIIRVSPRPILRLFCQESNRRRQKQPLGIAPEFILLIRNAVLCFSVVLWHRRSHDFVWGALFFPEKVDDLFKSSPS